MKTCSTCLIEKPLDCFGKAKRNKDGYKGQCKSCRQVYEKKYREENPEKIKKTLGEYYLKNKEEILEDKKEYYLENKEKKIKYNKEYSKKKRKESPQFKLAANLRGRLNMALQNNYKTGSAVKDLGCTIEEFKSYIESLWEPGMTWENYGRMGWHLDHDKPLSSFNLTKKEEFLIACHFTNIKPMWALDNIKKGAKIAA